MQAVVAVAVERRLAGTGVGADATHLIGARDDLRRGLRARCRYGARRQVADDTYAVVVRVGNIDVTVRCDLHAVRAVELRQVGTRPIAGEAALAGTGQGADGAVRRHHTHHAVHGVGDVHDAVAAQRHVARRVELGLGCRAA